MGQSSQDYSWIWIVVFLIGLIIFLIVLILIEERLVENRTINGGIWFFFFLSLILLILSFSIYLYYNVAKVEYTILGKENGWYSCENQQVSQVSQVITVTPVSNITPVISVTRENIVIPHSNYDI